MTMSLAELHSSSEVIEEVAEEYVLLHLTPTELHEYEQHLLVCRRCQNAVVTVGQFVEVFRAAIRPVTVTATPHAA
jgi:hypothetical protein